MCQESQDLSWILLQAGFLRKPTLSWRLTHRNFIMECSWDYCLTNQGRGSRTGQKKKWATKGLHQPIGCCGSIWDGPLELGWESGTSHPRVNQSLRYGLSGKRAWPWLMWLFLAEIISEKVNTWELSLVELSPTRKEYVFIPEWSQQCIQATTTTPLGKCKVIPNYSSLGPLQSTTVLVMALQRNRTSKTYLYLIYI